jgi:hypothetical protein
VCVEEKGHWKGSCNIKAWVVFSTSIQYNAVIHFFPIKVSLLLLYNSLILYIDFIGIHISVFSLFVGLCFLTGSPSQKSKDGATRTTPTRIKHHLNGMLFVPL